MKTNYLKIALLFLSITLFTNCEEGYEPPYVADLVRKIWIDSYTIGSTQYEQELIFNKSGDGSVLLTTFHSNGQIDREIYYFNWEYTKTSGNEKEIRMEYKEYQNYVIYFEIEELTDKVLKGYLDGEYVEFYSR